MNFQNKNTGGATRDVAQEELAMMVLPTLPNAMRTALILAAVIYIGVEAHRNIAPVLIALTTELLEMVRWEAGNTIAKYK